MRLKPLKLKQADSQSLLLKDVNSWKIERPGRKHLSTIKENEKGEQPSQNMLIKPDYSINESKIIPEEPSEKD